VITAMIIKGACTNELNEAVISVHARPENCPKLSTRVGQVEVVHVMVQYVLSNDNTRLGITSTSQKTSVSQ
jgi:hypothetical protein